MEKPGDSGLELIPERQKTTGWPTLVVEGGVPENWQLLSE